MAENAVDEPARIAKPEPCGEPPVDAPASAFSGAFPHQPGPDAAPSPPEKAEKEDHAEAETHDAVGIEQVQKNIVRVADGDDFPLRRQPQRAEGGVVLPRARAEPRMLEKDPPAQPPEVPAVVPGDVFRGQPRGLEEGKKAQNEGGPDQGAPLPAAAAQQYPEAEPPGDGQRPAAAGSPLKEEERRAEQEAEHRQRLHDAQFPPQDEPDAEGGDKGQGDIVAHGIVAEASREAPGVGRVAHDEIRACGGLPDAVKTFPEAGRHARPDETAQVAPVADAFHADERQDESLVDACPGVEQGIERGGRAQDADGDHEAGTAKKPFDPQARENAPAPGVAVVEREKNKADDGHDLAHAIANGKARQREPERAEQTGMPELRGPLGAGRAAAGQKGADTGACGGKMAVHGTFSLWPGGPSPARTPRRSGHG